MFKMFMTKLKVLYQALIHRRNFMRNIKQSYSLLKGYRCYDKAAKVTENFLVKDSIL